MTYYDYLDYAICTAVAIAIIIEIIKGILK